MTINYRRRARLGETEADSWAAFLAANPDQAAQLRTAQQQNEGDPILQRVMFNPVTGVVGPVPISYGTGDSGYNPPVVFTPPNNNLLYGGLAAAGLLLLISATGGRRRR